MIQIPWVYMNHKQQLETEGEKTAANYLQKVGYILVAKKVRIRGGELDLIMIDQANTLCFIDVQVRTNLRHYAEKRLSESKRKGMGRAARVFCLRNKIDPDTRNIRFDVVVAMKYEQWYLKHYKHLEVPLGW